MYTVQTETTFEVHVKTDQDRTLTKEEAKRIASSVAMDWMSKHGVSWFMEGDTERNAYNAVTVIYDGGYQRHEVAE